MTYVAFRLRGFQYVACLGKVGRALKSGFIFKSYLTFVKLFRVFEELNIKRIKLL